MKYRNIQKYRYQLVESEPTQLNADFFDVIAENDFIILVCGCLLIKEGYAWDGASGPAINTLTFVRGSLVHDALYQLIREGLLPRSYRRAADSLLRDICIEDGMNRIRAWYVYRSVRMFGGSSAKPRKRETYKTISSPSSAHGAGSR
jgi:hypothetical protein